MENDLTPQDTGATHSDAPVSNVDNRTEDQMLGDLLRSSDFTRDLFDEEALPETQEEIPATHGDDEDDDHIPMVDDEIEENPVVEEIPGEDDTSTQDSAYSLDDLDDFSVMVKIDGEEVPVKISELVKGYATDRSLSQKGRELGDARKQLDEERASKLGEVDRVMSAAASILVKSEEKFAREFHDIESKIKEARAEGDTHTLGELKDQKEVAQEKYWAARREREALVETANKQKQDIESQEWNQRLHHFQEGIVKAIPDWSEDVAVANRDFLLSRGISEDLIGRLVDVNAIKLWMISADMSSLAARVFRSVRTPQLNLSLYGKVSQCLRRLNKLNRQIGTRFFQVREVKLIMTHFSEDWQRSILINLPGIPRHF